MKFTLKYYLIIFLLVIGVKISAQTVLFSDDFESYGANFTLTGATAGWRVINSTASVNQWDVSNAACRISGNRSLMVTNASTGCTYAKNDNCDKLAYNTTGFSTVGYGCLFEFRFYMHWW